METSIKFLLIFLTTLLSSSPSTSEAVYKFCDGINIYKAPSDDSCSLFHFCLPGVEFYNWPCRDGLHYNRETKECTHPQTAECVLPCPENGDNFIQPYYPDCSMYLVCYLKEPVLVKCNDEFLFSVESNECEPYETVECGVRGNGTVTEVPVVTTTQSTETSSYNPNPICSDDQHPTFFPNPYECRNFSVCFDGMRITTQCTPGREFDYVSNACLENAMCSGKDSTTTSAILTTVSDTTTSLDTTEGSTTFSTTTSEVSTTPFDTTTFTEESTIFSSTTSEISTTTIRTTTKIPDRIECPVVPGIYYFPHKVDCTKFYRCFNGIAYLLRCEDGLQFDYIEEICKENANCYNA